MPIPGFQKLMLPIMKLLADRNEHTPKALIESLADQFRLNEEERKQLLPSRRGRLFANRVGWALSHLKMAEVLENPKRAVYRLSERGVGLLRDNPQTIDMRFLQRFPEYDVARKGGHEEKAELKEDDALGANPPQETMDQAYESLSAVLASDLLIRIKACDPLFFQKIVVDLLMKMGYGVPQDVERSIMRGADEGIDGVINQDRLGLERVYLQAKRWTGPVGRPEIQRFAGALQGQQAHKGVFITTSIFSQEAREYAARITTKIVLVDGALLAKLMIEHDVGTTTVKTYEVKQVDSDYFVED